MNEIGMACIELSDSEIDAAVSVLRSGALRQGNECENFEKEFAEYAGADYAITSSNGSAALHLAYLATLQEGDEVLVPSFTFIATASMVSMAGGKPVFVDIDPDTFLISLDDAEEKITERTRAIAPVHLFGNSCPILEIQKFAKKHDLLIIWDAAQAHGTKYGEKNIGAFDDFVAYSFYPSKNMFVGEGGITLTNNEEFANKIRYLRTHGQTGKYLHTMMGLNYRMTDVEAAIGREQLKRLEAMLAIRRRNAETLTNAIDSIEGLTVQATTPGSTHAWHQYCVRVTPAKFGMDRDDLAAKLQANGVGTGVHYPRGLHRQPVYEDLYGKSNLEHTDRLCEEILALPVHHGLKNSDVDRICELLKALSD